MAKECMAKLLPAKWYKRIEIALTGYHFIGDNGSKEQNNTCNVAPELENGGQYQVYESEKFNGITEFIAGMRIVCNRNERHIQHNFGIEPATFNRKFTKY